MYSSARLPAAAAAAMAGTDNTSDLKELRQEIALLKRHLRIISHHTKTIPLVISGFRLDQPCFQFSEPFYTHPCGHKVCLGAELIRSKENPDVKSFVIHACLMQGEFDHELSWPVKAKVTVQIINQNGDFDHIQRSKQISWQYKSRGDPLPIPVIMDVDIAVLVREDTGEEAARFLVRDTLMLSVKYMALAK